jgi:hypothetical protein
MGFSVPSVTALFCARALFLYDQSHPEHPLNGITTVGVFGRLILAFSAFLTCASLPSIKPTNKTELQKLSRALLDQEYAAQYHPRVPPGTSTVYFSERRWSCSHPNACPAAETS